MPVQLQLRRGVSALNDAFTGADGELSVNTDTKSIVSHDGAKQGGYEVGMPQAKGIIDLRSHTPTASAFRYLKYHTIAGDGGHGVFRAVTGAAVGTYVDNNATIIVPTGGNGSTAWIRNPLRNDEAGLDANGEVIQAQSGAAEQIAAGNASNTKRANGTWGATCTAWANFDGITGAIRSSFNIASVVKTAVGDYTVSFASPMIDTNYSSIANSVRPVAYSFGTPMRLSECTLFQITSLNVVTGYLDVNGIFIAEDSDVISVAIFGGK